MQSSTSVSMSTDNGMRKFGSESNSRNVSDFSSNSSTKNSFAVMSQRQSNLREFTFSELKTATKNFSRSLMIGEGGFGGVYRGIIRGSEDSHKKIDIAVKQLNRRGFQDHLSTRFQTTLPWATRLKIARDAARGLAFLHEGMEFQIIFRDFKSSNILLDEHWNAKLSDFGLARLGPSDGLSHVSTAVVGTIGYAAPEYIQTGRLTVKSDVWGYGVFLYELITGRRPLDRNRPKGEEKLLEWVRPHISDLKKFRLIIDPRLDGKYSIRSAHKLAAVANRCLARQPKQRPKMSEVLEMVNGIVESADSVSPQLDLKSSNPNTDFESSKRGSLKRRLLDLITGGNGCLIWRTWKPNIARTC
ncbi:hypothetical protein V6N13_012653 [Hibiscus sabdariffa]